MSSVYPWQPIYHDPYEYAFMNPYIDPSSRLGINQIGQLLSVGQSLMGYGKSFGGMPFAGQAGAGGFGASPFGGMLGLANSFGSPMGAMSGFGSSPFGGMGGFGGSPLGGLLGLMSKGMGGGAFGSPFGGSPGFGMFGQGFGKQPPLAYLVGPQGNFPGLGGSVPAYTL